MKVLITALAFLTASASFAGVRFYNSGGRAIGEFSDIVDAGGITVQSSGGKAKIFSNPKQRFALSGGVTTLLVNDCGSTVFNSGGTSTINLPKAVDGLGCSFTFINGGLDGVAANIVVNPDDSDLLLRLADKPGDAVQWSNSGASVMIEAISPRYWIPTASGGAGNVVVTDIN